MSNRLFWILLLVLGFLFLLEPMSDKYLNSLSKKIAQAIEETETISISVDIKDE